jgi:transcriptional regulator with XRE-family HTH domain
MKSLADIVAANLSRILKEKRVSQKELGKRSGVHLQTIHNYVNGKKGIRNETLQKIATGLEVELDDLLKGAGKDHSSGKGLSPSEVLELAQDVPEDILKMLSQCKGREDAFKLIRTLLLGITATRFKP